MGQRNASYVIVEMQDGYSKKKLRTVTTFYNQWNHVKLQAPKLVRGIKAVQAIKWQYVYDKENIIPQMYFINAGTNTYEDKGEQVTQFVGGYNNTNEMATGEESPFCEDNNNGWNIVKFIIDKDGGIKTELYCILGTEDEDETTTESAKSYFYEDVEPEQIKFLNSLKWNPKLKDEAETLINGLRKPILSNF